MIKEELITGFKTLFNPHRMGFRVYKLYLKLRNIPHEREKLLEDIIGTRRVWWLGECSGSWDVVIAFFCRSDQEFFYLKNEIVSSANKIIVEHSAQTLIDARQFTKRYFTNRVGDYSFIGGNVQEYQLSDWERQFLNTIVNDARLPISTLAKKLRSSTTKIRHNIQKLEKLGIITQYNIDVDYSKLGLSFYKVIIYYDKYTRDNEEEIFSYLATIPKLHHFIRNLNSIELELLVSTFEEHYEILEDLKKKFPYFVVSTDSLLIIRDKWTPGFESLRLDH